MAKRMPKGLAALSSAAIAAVYATGYLATEPAAVSLAAAPQPETAAAVAPQPKTAANATPGGAPVPQSPSPTAPASRPSPTAAPQSPAAPSLKDGTYRGTGSGRRGSVTVAVTIAGGRIVSAPITGVTTHYAQSVIAGLPGQVTARQSDRIDLVSGATESSLAYQRAVAQALSQAGASAAGAAQGASLAAQPAPLSGGSSLPPTTTGPAGQPNGQVVGGPIPGASPASDVRVTGPSGVIYRRRGIREGYGEREYDR